MKLSNMIWAVVMVVGVAAVIAVMVVAGQHQ
jgi:hypothetical protein